MELTAHNSLIIIYKKPADFLQISGFFYAILATLLNIIGLKKMDGFFLTSAPNFLVKISLLFSSFPSSILDEFLSSLSDVRTSLRDDYLLVEYLSF
jgi:hypothetical protein